MCVAGAPQAESSGMRTVTAIAKDVGLAWSSMTAHGSEYAPGAMLAPTLVFSENVVPFTGSTVSEEPPNAVRLHDTVKVADVGFWPGVIVPLSVTDCPGPTGCGKAPPVAFGGIDTLL